MSVFKQAKVIPITPDDGGHSPFGPSSLGYVAACPGYHGTPGTSDAADVGTRIHEALEHRDPTILHTDEETEVYEEAIRMEDEFLATANIRRDSWIDARELRLDIVLHLGHRIHGTCDRLTRYNPPGNVFITSAVMADYKTGEMPVPPPEDNWQAKAYVIGAFQTFTALEEIDFVFYLPRRKEVLHHRFTRAELPALVAEVSAVVRAGVQTRARFGTAHPPKPADLNPSDACQYCRFQPRCPALVLLVDKVNKGLQSQRPKRTLKLNHKDDPKAVEELYAVAQIVARWADAHRRLTVDMAKAGKVFPNLKLRSMGAVTSVPKDKVEQLHRFVSSYGITTPEFLESTTVRLGALADRIGGRAPGPKKAQEEAARSFVDDCKDAGLAETGETRYTMYIPV